MLVACDEGAGRPGAAALRFRVARASVCLWRRRRRDDGRSAPKRLGGGPKPVIREHVEAGLARLVEGAGDLTLAGYADRLAAETSVRVHPWTIGRALKRLG